MKSETVSTMAQVIGRTGKFHYASLCFDVEIYDVRQNYGRTDFYVKPVSGSGGQWVSAANVTIN